MKLLLLLVFIASCAHKPDTITIVEEKVIFVDMQTYKEWGTTNLVPVGRRPLPSESEICNNPLWIDTRGCQAYHMKNR